MTVNVIDAIINLLNNPIINLQATYLGRNRINNVGDALERYVQDLFINGFDLDENQRNFRINEHFSYLGNTSNPPDMMLRDGDAIEVKKIESRNSDLALNSSYPKATLNASSTMLTAACRTAEEWTQKDMLYAVGIINNQSLNALCFVYGVNYFANEKLYTIPTQSDFTDINEVVTVDLTAKWRIKNPFHVFDYIYQPKYSSDFNFMAIINDKKWQEFDNISSLEKMINNQPNAQLRTVEVKNPNLENAYESAHLITFFSK